MRSWTSGLRVLFVLGWVYPCTRSGGYDGKADAQCGACRFPEVKKQDLMDDVYITREPWLSNKVIVQTGV